jgi:hypothetical protein
MREGVSIESCFASHTFWARLNLSFRKSLLVEALGKTSKGCFTMGLIKAVGDFLFGKSPQIFDEQGRIRHPFSDEKWAKWNDRFKANPDYDWRHHSAKARGLKVTPQAPKK